MHMRSVHPRQDGMTIGSFILILLLAAALVFVFRYVQGAQQDNQEQAKKIQNALSGEEDAEQGEDTGEDNRSYTDQSQLWENPIRVLDVKKEPITVIFTATIPGSYQGTCAVELRYEGGTEKKRFVEPLRGTRTCEIYVPTGKLSDSKRWRYEFGYYSNDGRTYGKYPAGTLSL